MIFSQAFNPQAGLGGLLGVLITDLDVQLLQRSWSRIGSIAHSAVKTKYAASEGLVALLELY